VKIFLLLLFATLPLAAQEFPPSFRWPTNWPPRVHDPSTIVREGTNFWMFATGKGIFARRSTDLVTWSNASSVFTELPTTVRTQAMNHHGWLWAPDVMRVGERWLLFYSISEFGKNTSVIALASSPTLDPSAKNYSWRDDGIVVRSTRTNDFNAIDPAVFRDDDGKLWLAFGSFWSGIQLVELDARTGKRASTNRFRLAWSKAIEAASIAQHGADYFLFVNWGICCRGTNSTYEIRVGRSRAVTGPYRDQLGRDLREGNGEPFLEADGRFLGPGHASVLCDGTNEFVSFHFYDATRRGAATLGVRRLNWDTNGWPQAGEWVSPPVVNADSKSAK
jgi:arabinan endo-1,5-alpha-L-arabinosidase